MSCNMRDINVHLPNAKVLIVKDFFFFADHKQLSNFRSNVVGLGYVNEDKVTAKMHVHKADADNLHATIAHIHHACPTMRQCAHFAECRGSGLVRSSRLFYSGMSNIGACSVAHMHCVVQNYISGHTIHDVLNDDDLLKSIYYASQIDLGMIDLEHATYTGDINSRTFPPSAFDGVDHKDFSIFVHNELNASQMVQPVFNGRGHMWMRLLYDLNLSSRELYKWKPFAIFTQSVLANNKLADYFTPLLGNDIATSAEIHAFIAKLEAECTAAVNIVSDAAVKGCQPLKRKSCDNNAKHILYSVMCRLLRKLAIYIDACAQDGFIHFDFKTANIVCIEN